MLTFKDYLGYAQSEPSLTNPRGWAMRHFPKRTPEAEHLVAEWRRKCAEVMACRPSRDVRLTPFHAAAQIISSLAQAPGADVSSAIEQLENVSDDTRRLLRERFLRPPAARASP